MLNRPILISLVGQGVIAALTVALTPLYARLLGLEAFGLLGVYSVVQSCSVVLEFGLAATLGRETARFSVPGGTTRSVRRLLDHAEIVVALMAAALSIAMIVGAGFIVDSWLDLEDLDALSARRAISCMGVIAGLKLLEMLYQSCLIGLQRQILAVGISTSFALLRGAGAVCVLALFAPTVDAYFHWQIAVSVPQLLVLKVVVGRLIPRVPNSVSAQSLWSPAVRSFAMGITGMTLVSVVVAQVDRVILASLLPISMLGMFGLMLTLASGLALLAAPIGQVFQPRLTRCFDAKQEGSFAKEFHRGAQFIGLMTYSPAALLIMLPNQTLWAWTGRTDFPDEAIWTLRLLSIGFLMNCMLWMPHQAQIAAGWTKLMLRMSAFCAMIAIPSSILFIKEFGLPGAAIGFLLSNSLSLVIAVPVVCKRLFSGQWSRWILGDCVLPLAGALVVGAAGATYQAQSRLGSSVMLLALGFLAALASLSLSDQLRPEFIRLIRPRSPGGV
jgi:O-antigen/teichoic acid export membrane protein